MSYAAVTAAHISAGDDGGNGFDTSGSPIDTTGCDLLVAVVSSYAATTAPTFSDSKSNTWQALTEQATSSNREIIYYAYNPTVGTGHYFTTAGTTSYSSICVQGFSGALLTDPLDTPTSGTTSESGTTIQAGAITPGENNELVISAVSVVADGLPSIDAGFTLAESISHTGTSMGSGLAYKIQTTAASVQPTWTVPDGKATMTNCCFKAAVGGGGGSPGGGPGGSPGPRKGPLINSDIVYLPVGKGLVS